MSKCITKHHLIALGVYRVDCFIEPREMAFLAKIRNKVSINWPAIIKHELTIENQSTRSYGKSTEL